MLTGTLIAYFFGNKKLQKRIMTFFWKNWWIDYLLLIGLIISLFTVIS